MFSKFEKQFKIYITGIFRIKWEITWLQLEILINNGKVCECVLSRSNTQRFFVVLFCFCLSCKISLGTAPRM